MDEATKSREQLVDELARLQTHVVALEQREASLRESEAKYRSIVENANDIIYTHDMEGNFTSANLATVRTYGYPIEEFFRLNIRHVVDEEYLAVARENIRKKLGGMTYTEPYELLTLAKDGSHVWVEVASRVIRQAGRPVGVQGILRNITERKRAEDALRRARDDLEIRVQERTAELTAANRQLQREIAEHRQTEHALRESEARYRLLAENVTDVIWTTDMDLRFTYISPSTTRLRGFTVAEAMSQSVGEMLTPASYEVVMAVFKELPSADEMTEADLHRSWTMDLEVARKDGSTLWTEVRTSIMRDVDGNPLGLLGVTRDVTARKRAELEKAELQEQLHQAQKMQAVGQLAAGVAHDFSNLLAVIAGHAGQARSCLPQADRVEQQLVLVEQACQQAVDVADSLLTFSRNVPSSKRRIDLCALVEQSTRLLRRILPASIELVVDTTGGAPVWVNADTTQLQQVILNLVINARDAMPDGGSLAVSVSRSARDDTPRHATPPTGEGPVARLVIRDTGSGMRPEVTNRIFEPFFTTKERGQGTGLGLSIVHGIVEDHVGRIEVESRVGGGSTFMISLPCMEPDVAIRPSVPSALEGEPEGGVILLGEGHRLLREIMVAALRALGHEVIPVNDGRAVFDRHQERAADIRLVILDADLPNGGGVDCLDRLRNEGRQTPVVILSAGGDYDWKDRLDDNTVLLDKPFSMPELVAVVGGMLGRRGDREGAR